MSKFRKTSNGWINRDFVAAIKTTNIQEKGVELWVNSYFYAVFPPDVIGRPHQQCLESKHNSKAEAEAEVQSVVREV